MAQIKGLDESEDAANNQHIFEQNGSIKSYGEWLLLTGTNSDIILEVHALKREKKKQNENENDDEAKESELEQTSAADRDILQSESAQTVSDEFSVHHFDQKDIHSDSTLIVREYRLHRSALSLCEYFGSKLSKRWKGAKLIVVVYKTQFELQVIGKCLKILYCNDWELENVTDALRIFTVFCEWNYLFGIDGCIKYLSHRLTASNVGTIYASAERMNQRKLLDLCRSNDPTCNLLSVRKMKEILIVAIKFNKNWAMKIAQKEFRENYVRNRSDINASYLKDTLNALLSSIKKYLPFKGCDWLQLTINEWMPCLEQFAVWSIHSNVIELFNKEHNISITNPRQYQFVRLQIEAMLNAFICRFFVNKHINTIPWSKIFAFLHSWSKHINSQSMACILNVTPPLIQQSICECCIDWVEEQQSDILKDQDTDLVLSAIMKCQERAKFWEKAQKRNVTPTESAAVNI